jgi:hypothetical protein
LAAILNTQKNKKAVVAMTSSVLDGIVSEEITWSMLVFWERMHFRLVPKKLCRRVKSAACLYYCR